MKTLLLLFGMVGMGWGQTVPAMSACNKSDGEPNGNWVAVWKETHWCLVPLPKPSPIDVPAIEHSCYLTAEKIKQGYCCASGSEPQNGCQHSSVSWTCKDTSRILLTAENGTKWCHKPQTD